MITESRRVVVVTGASAGIGKATAEYFARRGWHVIGTGRNPQHLATAETDVRAAASAEARVDFVRGDFCELADVRRVAGEIKSLTDRIDTLINNAGGVRDRRYTTSEGLEATMAANHFATFLLTRELMPLLKRAAEGDPGKVRVLVVSSEAHQSCLGMRWNDLHWEQDYAATGMYCQAKLANILFTRELDRRAAADGIVAQSMHPGVVKTNFAVYGDDALKAYLADVFAHPPEHTAETLYWMATAPETGTDGGRYFYALKEATSGEHARDDAAAAKLWEETEKTLTALGY